MSSSGHKATTHHISYLLLRTCTGQMFLIPFGLIGFLQFIVTCLPFDLIHFLQSVEVLLVSDKTEIKVRGPVRRGAPGCRDRCDGFTGAMGFQPNYR